MVVCLPRAATSRRRASVSSFVVSFFFFYFFFFFFFSFVSGNEAEVVDDDKKASTTITKTNKHLFLSTIPHWAQARNELDLESDRKYALKNADHAINGDGKAFVEETIRDEATGEVLKVEKRKAKARERTTRAKAYVNFEKLFAGSAGKSKKAKRTPARTCAERKRDDESGFVRKNDNTKQLGVVIVVCFENVSTLLREIDCEKTNVYAYVKCAQHLVFDEDVAEKVDACVTVIHSKITRRPNAKMHVEWMGHILARYDALEPNLMFLKGVYRNKGKSSLDPAWINALQSEEQTAAMDFSFACLMEQSTDFPVRSENLLDTTDSENLLCSLYERYSCEKDTCKNFLGCAHSMFAASSERIRSLPKTEYLHLYDFLMNERSDYHIYTMEKVWAVILGCAKTYGAYVRDKQLPLRVRCGRGEYGTFDVAQVLSPWWIDILTRQGVEPKSPPITMTPCENRTKHFYDSWFPCGLF
jgi:hypothetical protein